MKTAPAFFSGGSSRIAHPLGSKDFLPHTPLMPGKTRRDDVQITLGTARICNLLGYDIGNNQSDIRNLYVVQTLSELFPHAVVECSHLAIITRWR